MPWKMLALGSLLVGLNACTTTSEKPIEGDLVLGEPVLHEFRPAQLISGLTQESGRYPTLLHPASYAVLVTPEVLQLKDSEEDPSVGIDPVFAREMDGFDEHFWVFELRLESIFADSSIAYDVVGLRNMTVFLVTPEGERLTALQRIPSSSASEDLEGALRRFGRTNLIMFPKRDLISGDAWLGPEAPMLKLVIEGFHSEFSFSWDALPPEALINPDPIEDPSRWQAIRSNLVEFYQDLRTMMSMAH